MAETVESDRAIIVPRQNLAAFAGAFLANGVGAVCALFLRMYQITSGFRQLPDARYEAPYFKYALISFAVGVLVTLLAGVVSYVATPCSKVGDGKASGKTDVMAAYALLFASVAVFAAGSFFLLNAL